MMKIKLASGGFTLVDDDDYHGFSSRKWTENTGGYAQGFKNKTTTRMHREILNISNPLQIVDHINGNKLDNRRSNLRIVSSSQNRMNSEKPSTNKSGFKGVSWRQNTTNKNWVAFIYKNYKQYYLGYFKNPLDAAKAYDKAAKELHGRFAKLNFPEGVVV